MKKKTTIVQELHKLVLEKNICVDGEVNESNWRAFKAKYKFTNTSMTALIKKARENFLRSKLIKGGKNQALLEHTGRVFPNFINEKNIVRFQRDAHFNLVNFEA